MAEPAPASTRPAEMALRFEGVRMVFANALRRPVEALRGFNLSVAPGAVVGLLGPNGSGKTTALSCLLGLLQPQEGEVWLWGRRVEGSIARDDGLLVGVLLEDTKLPPFLSVRSALSLVCRVRGFHGAALRTELRRVVEQSRCESLLDHKVAALSKGQARRVGLAAALVGDPELLVLDEPSAGLDVSAREEFNGLVRGLRDGRRTMLIASHLLSDVESTCSHVAIIRDGVVLVHDQAERMLREARARCDQKDFYVDQGHAETLTQLGVGFSASKYPGLVLLRVEGPEHELMLRLAGARIVPSRIEPRVNLVSVYLELVGREQ